MMPVWLQLDPTLYLTPLFDRPPAWTPAMPNLDGSSPIVWLKSDAIAGLSNGDAVTTWGASLPTTVDVTQSDATKKPIYVTNVLNGMPGVKFDNINDCLSGAVDLSSYNKATIFLLCVPTAVGTTGVAVDYGVGDDGSFSVFMNTDSKMYTIHTKGANLSSYACTRLLTAGAPMLFAFTHDLSIAADECEGYFDGINGGHRPLNDDCTGNFGNKTLFVGSRNDGGSYPSNMTILEIIIYPGTVSSAAARNQVNSYIYSKWMPNAIGSDFSDNGYTTIANIPGGGTYVQTSAGATLIYSTDAEYLFLNCYSNIFSTFPTMGEIGIQVNGVDFGVVEPTADGIFDAVVNLGVGAKIVKLIMSLQSKPASLIGTFVRRAAFNKRATLIMGPKSPCIAFYGNSISVGANAGNPSLQGNVQIVRNAYTGSVIQEAFGYRSLYDDCYDAAARTAFANHLLSMNPTIIYIEVGTNDYGRDKWPSSDFGVAYGDLLDKIHAVLPSTVVYCQSPTVRTVETERTAGWGDLDAYRTEISNAVSTRTSFATFVDGTDAAFPQLADLDDGVHPTTAGQSKLGNAEKSVLGI